MQTTVNLHNHKETFDLGSKISKLIGIKPCLIFLRGKLGAGKTTLAQGFIKDRLKNDNEQVTSPSYSYLNSYNSVPTLYHFDLYRIEHSKNFLELGLNEFIEDQSAIRLVEWPERAIEYLAKCDIDVELVDYNHGRQATIKTKMKDLLIALGD